MFGNLFKIKDAANIASSIYDDASSVEESALLDSLSTDELLGIISDDSIEWCMEGAFRINKKKEGAVARIIKPLILEHGCSWLSHECNINIYKCTLPVMAAPNGDGNYITVRCYDDAAGDISIEIYERYNSRDYNLILEAMNDPCVISMDQEYKKFKVNESREFRSRLLAEKLSKIVK